MRVCVRIPSHPVERQSEAEGPRREDTLGQKSAIGVAVTTQEKHAGKTQTESSFIIRRASRRQVEMMIIFCCRWPKRKKTRLKLNQQPGSARQATCWPN